MFMFAAAAATAALLVAGPAAAPTAEAVSLAAHAGFLLGNAHRCGIPSERVIAAGQLVRDLIAAAARDTQESEDANARFAQFFLATAYPDEEKGALVASCKTVSAEFARLERHDSGAGSLTGSSARPPAAAGAGQ